VKLSRISGIRSRAQGHLRTESADKEKVRPKSIRVKETAEAGDIRVGGPEMVSDTYK